MGVFDDTVIVFKSVFTNCELKPGPRVSSCHCYPKWWVTSFMITSAALQKKEREFRSDLQLVFCAASTCPHPLHQKSMWECDSHHLGWIRFSPEILNEVKIKCKEEESELSVREGCVIKSRYCFASAAFPLPFHSVQSHKSSCVVPFSCNAWPSWLVETDVCRGSLNSSRGTRS